MKETIKRKLAIVYFAILPIDIAVWFLTLNLKSMIVWWLCCSIMVVWMLILCASVGKTIDNYERSLQE